MNHENNIKVALLSARSGYISRGVEKWSFELKRRLPFQTEVFSLAETDWTWKVAGIRRDESKYKSYMTVYNAVDRIRRIHPKINTVIHHSLLSLPYNSTWLSEHDGEVISYAVNLGKELRRYKPDLIINHMGGLVGAVLRNYRRKYRVPFMAVGGSGIGIGEYKNATTMPNAYIAQTPANQMFIAQKVPGLRVELIPNGFDVNEFVNSQSVFSKEELQKRNKIGSCAWEQPFILSTSHFNRHKRLDRVIDAVALLQKGTLIFTGDGEAREELIALARQKLPDRFAYFGVLPWDDMPTLYRTADVFTLPSIAEPFGGVFVEALGANTPVVAHRDTDREWIVGTEGGILTDVTEPAIYADAIKQCSETDWKTGPQNQALKFFDWDVIAQKYATVASSIIKLYSKSYEELP
jgi:glycosyltransferase involved in cell wall biosynthesis